MWKLGELKDAVHPDLMPGKEYVLYAFYMDKDGNVPADAKVARAEFKTAEAEKAAYGEIHISAYYDNNPYKPRILVDFDPDNKEAFYFWTYRTASEVAGMTDEQLVAEFESYIHSTNYLYKGFDGGNIDDPSKKEYIIYAMYIGEDLKKPAETALFKQSVMVN